MNENNGESNYQSFPIIGIGASAGGLEALEIFVKNIPIDSGMSYIIVQHLSPDYKSLMVELLSKHTRLKVQRVEDGMIAEPDSIYLIPPRKSLTIFHGKLYLTDLSYGKVLNLPIDVFFRSLAEDQGEKAVGIILSGTGSDGTLGVRAIKGSGGMIIVQDPDSAKFDGMPKSAINTGLADYILAPENMPERIKGYFQHFYNYRTDNTANALFLDESSLLKILSIIKNKSGMDFTNYKPNTIIRRVERRISINQIDSASEYISLLLRSESEINTLYKDLLINVTKFFRDSDAFDIIKSKVIPNILKSKNPDDPVRVWSIGCSTGEEAYTLAMLFSEVMEDNDQDLSIKVFATDIDREAIEFAGYGLYPESIISDIGPQRLKKFFISRNEGYQINENIRKMVIFATHNIIKDPPFSKIDLICCRNMLIYLKPNAQRKILSIFHFSLNQEGYLFLGNSESIGELTNMFSVYDNKWKIYTYKEGIYLPKPNDLLFPMLNRDKSGIMRKEPFVPKDMDKERVIDSIYETLINDYIPPSIIIDEKGELVYIIGNVQKYVSLPSGRISVNIQKILNKDILTIVNVAIHKVRKERKDIFYKGIKIGNDDNSILIDMRVRPLYDKRNRRMMIMVIFEEVKQKESRIIESEDDCQSSIQNQRIMDMEQELIYTKENLQAAIEELETSNEELQSTNEELISSNEELQSTNEELQSVNEELYTVNSEHQKKIEELTQLNNDINNLLKNTNIGTIFLDKQLLIRKWTPAIKSVINIIDTDVGRPIHHISHNTLYENFLDDIKKVLNTLKEKEVEIRGKDDKWFLMRIIPYRTIENAVDGVVITFVDITEIKEFEETIDRERRLLYSVLDNSPVCKTIVDITGDITYANYHAQKLFGLVKEDISQRRFDSPEWQISDEEGNPIRPEDLPFSKIIKTKEPIYDFRHYIYRESDKKKTLLSINGAPIFDENKEVTGVIFAILDITDQKEHEKKLLFERELLYKFLELNPLPAVIVDSRFIVKFLNIKAKDLLGFKDEGQDIYFFKNNTLEIERGSQNDNCLSKTITDSKKPLYKIKHTINFNEGNSKEILIDSFPILKSNEFLGAVFIIDH